MIVACGFGTVQSVRIEIMVSTWVLSRDERMEGMSSAPQERITRVPSDSVNPQLEATMRSWSCMSVFGSSATYLVILLRSRYLAEWPYPAQLLHINRHRMSVILPAPRSRTTPAAWGVISSSLTGLPPSSTLFPKTIQTLAMNICESLCGWNNRLGERHIDASVGQKAA